MKKYEFECNINLDEVINYVNELWGAAYIWYGDKGVEYNLCMDGNENCCAIYKMEFKEETDDWETDHSVFVHYEINPNHEDWEKELEKAMINALKRFFNL